MLKRERSERFYFLVFNKDCTTKDITYNKDRNCYVVLSDSDEYDENEFLKIRLRTR